MLKYRTVHDSKTSKLGLEVIWKFGKWFGTDLGGGIFSGFSKDSGYRLEVVCSYDVTHGKFRHITGEKIIRSKKCKL